MCQYVALKAGKVQRLQFHGFMNPYGAAYFVDLDQDCRPDEFGAQWLLEGLRSEHANPFADQCFSSDKAGAIQAEYCRDCWSIGSRCFYLCVGHLVKDQSDPGKSGMEWLLLAAALATLWGNLQFRSVLFAWVASQSCLSELFEIKTVRCLIGGTTPHEQQALAMGLRIFCQLPSAYHL